VARTRTTKKLAQRIDLNYFKKPHPLRRWLFIASVALPVAALIWLAWHGIQRDRRVFSAGPLAPAHAVLTSQCSACHETRLLFTTTKPSDQKCQACHVGSIHHATQTFTPACASCHVDHRGAIRLAATADSACTQCHANLATRGVSVNFVRNISSFENDHPEFAVLRSGRPATGTIQLNHYLHMKADLMGPNGRVQMVCDDCHRSAADASQPWRFADPQSLIDAQSAPETTTAGPIAANVSPRAYMLPSTYARTCSGCHSLQFDKRIPASVPHDTPQVIHPFIVAKLQAYIAAHPAELRVAREPDRDLPEKPVPAEYRLLTPAQWVGERTAEAEQLLWRKTCKQCHTLVFSGNDALPKVAPSNLVVRYMPHARFDHSRHGLVTCTSCHAAAITSQQSTDLLLPGIATCRSCHKTGAEAAESRCFECHTYHDPTRHQPAHSNFSLADLVGKAALPVNAQ
jgi:hypothetical protein